MALYDSLFSQLDITSSQLLVTDNDFKSPEFRHQLSQTINSLLALRSIPIFNENDAISMRRAPYEDSTGIFWDNDNLASLLALELNADLLVLFSDVEGLYTGPPSDPNSKLIHAYIKKRHQGAITFGDKSRVGRGGMTAKVKAAVNAADAGTPVVIASGFLAENISKVLEGQSIGTLFHRDAQSWTIINESGARDMAVAARECSLRLQYISPFTLPSSNPKDGQDDDAALTVFLASFIDYTPTVHFCDRVGRRGYLYSSILTEERNRHQRFLKMM